MDSLLTNITLYWVTGAINSSFWPYYAIRHEPWPLPNARIEVPMAYAVVPARDRATRRAASPSRSSTSAAGPAAARRPLRRAGGPELLADDVAAFFRSLRQDG